ncbi:MAG: hypothetical protein JRN28_00870 [Nitrososphaerota archaeon]|nr:hypothetical protein [Nitrososphaerota archaeon]
MVALLSFSFSWMFLWVFATYLSTSEDPAFREIRLTARLLFGRLFHTPLVHDRGR